MVRLMFDTDWQMWCFRRADGTTVVLGAEPAYRFHSDAVSAASESGFHVKTSGTLVSYRKAS